MVVSGCMARLQRAAIGCRTVALPCVDFSRASRGQLLTSPLSASSTFYRTNKTVMKRNHTAENIPDDVDYAGVRKAGRALQAATPTKRAEDAAVHVETAKRQREKAEAAAEASQKRQRRVDGIAKDHSRISSTNDLTSLDWESVLAQCRLRFYNPHPGLAHLGRKGKPFVGKESKADHEKRCASLLHILALERALPVLPAD
eukprot:TRINITY_DN26865_c0_g1_i1.p2 TRINITY_DN26865_c0_g1~~TRINITY_DN26865_c0_g1_i1.p2  ORF type:complete len:201 (+),score=18.11 TRINITY_DN26865_c0_g1_i1:485-1087(+)